MERYEGFEQWLPRTNRAETRLATISNPVRAQWFDALYESPMLFSGLLDRDCRVVEANRLSVEGCGFRRDATLGRPFWDGGWWSADEALALRIRTWCTRAVATGEALSAVTRYFRGDGSIGMVELGLVPIIDFDATAEPVSHIVATGLDISALLSEQAAREDRLRAQRQASQQAEQRFRDALDAMIDHVTIARSLRNADGAIVDFEIEFVNSASTDGAGRTSTQLVGGRVCELYPLWRESEMFARFASVVETGASFVADRLPYVDSLDEGTPFSGFWDLRVARLDDGYIAASRDVTSVVRAEEVIRITEAAAAREQLAMDILQRAALNVHPPDLPGVRIGLHYQPALTEMPIGGDWYDVIALPDGQIVLIIADVAGHGPQIASFMVQLRNILRAIATEPSDPADLLRRVNKRRRDAARRRPVHDVLRGRDRPVAAHAALVARRSPAGARPQRRRQRPLPLVPAGTPARPAVRRRVHERNDRGAPRRPVPAVHRWADRNPTDVARLRHGAAPHGSRRLDRTRPAGGSGMARSNGQLWDGRRRRHRRRRHRIAAPRRRPGQAPPLAAVTLVAGRCAPRAASTTAAHIGKAGAMYGLHMFRTVSTVAAFALIVVGLAACSSDSKTSTTTTTTRPSVASATTSTSVSPGAVTTTTVARATGSTATGSTGSTVAGATTTVKATATTTAGRVVTNPSDSVKIGDSGSGVKQIQAALIAHGYKVSNDGKFGQQTSTAVKSFQTKNGLLADGVVGPKTWAKLSVAATGATSTTVKSSTSTTKPATTSTTTAAGSTTSKP